MNNFLPVTEQKVSFFFGGGDILDTIFFCFLGYCIDFIPVLNAVLEAKAPTDHLIIQNIYVS